MYDIIVVGGGPAGAVFAGNLDKRFSVLLIDKKSEKGGFRKPCGGLLAPDAQNALAVLGLNLPKEILVDPQIFSVRTIDLDNGLTRNYRRMYINLDRHKFDMWLMDNIPDKVERAEGVFLSVEKEGEAFKVRYSCGGRELVAYSKYLIGADGAKSSVRNTFCGRLKTRKYISVQQWFREENPTPFYSCIFDSESTDCYSWTISKDGYFIFGGAYPTEKGRKAFESQKQKLTRLGIKFGEPIKTEACLVLRPTGKKSYSTGKDRLFLIGEAAGFVSPSSLEGISSAIISGMKLSEAFNCHEDNIRKFYDREISFLKRKLSAKNLKCPFMYNPFIRKLVMKSGISSVSVKNSQK